MSNYISRQAAIDAVNNALISWSHMAEWRDNKIRKAIMELPSAQPETAKRIVVKSRDGVTHWYQCDMCNEPVDVQDNYCRGCGRRLIDE